MEQKENKTHYEILGISHKATHEEIKNAYYNLIKKLHPDKKNKNEIDELYLKRVKTINKAYDVLKHALKRSDYDNSLKIVKKKDSDFKTMKDEALAFIKSMDIPKEKFDESKGKAKADFKLMTDEINRKMCLDKSKMSKQDTDVLEKEIQELELSREQEEIENLPERIFNPDEKFEINRFNDAFESILGENDESLIEFNGSAHAFDYNNTQSYANIFEDLPGDVISDPLGNKLSRPMKINTRKLDKAPKTMNDIERLMKERELETQQLQGMKFGEFKTNECINAEGNDDNAENWLKE